MQILVGVDGSKKSKKVVDYAAEFAKELSAKIILMHVIPDEPVPEDFAAYAKMEQVDPATYYEEVGDAILSKSVGVLNDKGIEYEKLLDFGNPSSRILDVAKSKQVQFIIVGLQGLHGINRIRSLGSVSRRVVEDASCPVVVVPET